MQQMCFCCLLQGYRSHCRHTSVGVAIAPLSMNVGAQIQHRASSQFLNGNSNARVMHFGAHFSYPYQYHAICSWNIHAIAAVCTDILCKRCCGGVQCANTEKEQRRHCYGQWKCGENVSYATAPPVAPMCAWLYAIRILFLFIVICSVGLWSRCWTPTNVFSGAIHQYNRTAYIEWTIRTTERRNPQQTHNTTVIHKLGFENRIQLNGFRSIYLNSNPLSSSPLFLSLIFLFISSGFIRRCW